MLSVVLAAPPTCVACYLVLTFIQEELVGSSRLLSVTVSSMCGLSAPDMFSTGMVSVAPLLVKLRSVLRT